MNQTFIWPVVLFVYLSLALYPVYINAQQNYNIRFAHLTRDNGLSSNRINFIAEDSLGFIWFATEEGLDRFDGYEVKNYTGFFPKEKGYSDYATDYILEDINKPNLWIATRKGLVYFDRRHNSFHLITNFGDSLKNRIQNITTLCFDAKNNIWIGTFNGLFSWDANKHKLTTLIAPNQNKYSRINTLYKDNHGRMWIGSDSGLFHFREKDSNFIQHFPHRFQNITLIKQDSLNHFIVGSRNSGLFFLNDLPKMKVIRHLSKENGYFVNNRITGVIQVLQNLYYILIRDGGLYLYNSRTDKIKYFPYDIHNPNGINSTALTTGLKSSQGIIWIGTYNSGINYYDQMQKKFMLFKVNFKKTGLFNNNIRALAEDDNGYIWVGTKEGGGLSRFDKKSGTFINYRKSNTKEGLRDDFIFSICNINKRKLLVGTFRAGLAEFDKKTKKFKYYTHLLSKPNSLYDNRIYIVYKDSENKIWVGNYFNLQLFNLKKEIFHTIPNILLPRCICEEDKDHLWIGSNNYGLYLFNKRNKTFVRFYHRHNDTNSLICNHVYAITKDKHGNIWIGTKQGLDKMNIRTKQFTHYSKKNGLASNWIKALQIDDQDNIWASTSFGIFKFNIINHKIHNYDVSDNLQGNEFNRYVSLKTHDGFILFGGHNGFNLFQPEQIIDNKRIPPVYITGLQILDKKHSKRGIAIAINRSLLFSKKIVLKHNLSEFTIKFIALNYTSPFKNQYAYKLEGFNKNWIYNGERRSAVFTNIPSGKYTFRVKASNNDNYWNEKGDAMEIVILPPWWQTIWAYTIYFITIVLLFLLFRKVITVRIQQKNLLEFERLDKKRIQEINQMKLQFFTNISHEFRTPLTLISSPLEQLISHNTTNEKHQKYYLSIIKRNVDKLLFLVNELMDFRKSEQGRLKLHISQNDLVKNVKENIACFELKMKEKGITVSFHQEADNQTVWFDESIISKVMFNLLSNAVKFTNKNGEIHIHLKIKDGIAQFSITNSGNGIPQKDLVHIFERFYQFEDNYLGQNTGTGIGLTFSKRLIETHKGTIEVTSQPQKDTTFTITFPVNFESYKDEIISKKSKQQNFIPNPDSYHKKEDQNSETAHLTSLHSEKILIVEDNEELREYLKNIFSNYEVFTADNGKTGLKQVTKQLPHLIISDIMMPEMDGFTLCTHVKTNFLTSHIPVILLTAKTDIEHKIKGIETGADAYIEKPFNIQYLQAMVENLLQQRKKLRARYISEPDISIEETIFAPGEKTFIDKIKQVMQKNIDNPNFSVEMLSRELGFSRSQLFRKFKAIFGVKPNEFIRVEKLKYAKKLLLEKDININEVAIEAGFNSTSYFITSFKKHFGETPSSILKKKKPDTFL